MAALQTWIWDWWVSLGELRASYVEGVATVLAAMVGAVAISWQIGRQAAHAIEQNRLNEGMKLRLEIYREVEALCTRAVAADIELRAKLHNALMQLKQYAAYVELRGDPLPPRARAQQFLALQDTSFSLLVELISSVERWKIVDPRLAVFQTAFNVAQFELTNAWVPTFRAALFILPMDPPAGSEMLWDAPTKEALEQFSECIQEFDLAGGRFGSWIDDYRRELQRSMLGGLFGNDLPYREPVDPRFIVVRLDRHAEIERHFREQTEWGRQATDAIARARAEMMAEASAATSRSSSSP